MARYLLMEIRCLECVGEDCEAKVLIRTDSLDGARAGMKDQYSTEWDTFIIDTETGDVVVSTNSLSSELGKELA